MAEWLKYCLIAELSLLVLTGCGGGAPTEPPTLARSRVRRANISLPQFRIENITQVPGDKYRVVVDGSTEVRVVQEVCQMIDGKVIDPMLGKVEITTEIENCKQELTQIQSSAATQTPFTGRGGGAPTPTPGFAQPTTTSSQ